MDFEARRKIASGWTLDLTGLFGRRTAPRRLDTKDKRTGELEAIDRRIAREVPAYVEEHAFRALLEEVGDDLDVSIETASWPTFFEVARCIHKHAERLACFRR